MIITIYIKLIFLIAGLSLLVSCGPRSHVYGYIVAKEYVPKHMSDVPARPVRYAAYFPVVVPRLTKTPQQIPSVWTVWVANRYYTEQVQVDSASFYRLKCGQKVNWTR